METQPTSRPAKGFLAVLGLGGILLGVLVSAELVIPLQPPLGAGGQPPPPGVASISMPPNAAQFNFSPANITVVIGVNNTIVWTNDDTIIHTVFTSSVPSGGSAFQSPILSHGDTFRVTLNATGVYDYYCSIHPATMKGSITVKSGFTVIIGPGTASQQLNFSPSSFTVVVGFNNTVRFVNQDSVVHTVTSDDGTTFDSRDIAPGASWSFTFVRVGTFAFHCNYHPAFMKGSVTVLGQAGQS